MMKRLYIRPTSPCFEYLAEDFHDGHEQGPWEQEEGDEDMEEAYSMYLDARKRFAELRE